MIMETVDEVVEKAKRSKVASQAMQNVTEETKNKVGDNPFTMDGEEPWSILR